jgi:UDP-N-acetylmuramoyl-tripeptide--D-alanyl-D-alanine ligase
MPVSGLDLIAVAAAIAGDADALRTADFPSVAIDSRNMESGAVFFAIRGERRDGHNFVAAASVAAGAVVVDETWWSGVDSGTKSEIKAPVVVVSDTVEALGGLARMHRRRYPIPMLAITGSSGKTTTKDMVVHMLESKYSVHHTRGNFNNHLGLPLTICALNEAHDVSVVEMGMNHPGEIERLCAIAEPTVGLITNIGKGHLGFFDSVKDLAREKGMLFRWIEYDPNRRGVVNADDERVVGQAESLPNRFTFSMVREDADMRGGIGAQDDSGRCLFSFRPRSGKEWYTVRLPVPGRHQTLNALAAASAAFLLGVTPSAICKALTAFTPPEKRAAIKRAGSITIVDDTYNANPESVRAAMDMFQGLRTEGKKILVLGDMLELGTASGEEHGHIGLLAAEMGFEYVFTFGSDAEAIFAASAAPFGGHYTDKGDLIRDLLAVLDSGDGVLVKGSRGMKMEEIAEAVEKHAGAPEVYGDAGKNQ